MVRKSVWAFIGGIASATAFIMLLGAGGTVSDPLGTAPDRYAYYPGTEPLSKDEIRVIACGTGMPAARRGQAATCFLVETGNGAKFLLDGPLVEQRRHGCVAAGRYEMSPTDARADIRAVVAMRPEYSI
jgi:hypothetical protein